MPTADQPTPPVDWQTVQSEILCPLCDYNLRGLIEPRCPECGYRFDWPDLIDPARRRHPYLFEHHPQRRIWSFYRTLKGGLRPKKFWTSLHPAQPSHVRRLLVYWIVCNPGFLLLPLATVAVDFVSFARQIQQNRAQMTAFYTASPALSRFSSSFRARVTTRAAFDQYLDETSPLPPSLRFFQAAIRVSIEKGNALVALFGSLLLASWPWIVFLPLMIFGVSMQRAHVKTIHVVRCVLYTSDTSLWVVALALLLAVLTTLAALYTGVSWLDRHDFMALAIAALMGVFLLLYLWRLTVAYRRYLKFDHSFATVLSAHIIAVLSVPTVLGLIGMFSSDVSGRFHLVMSRWIIRVWRSRLR